MRPFTVGHVVTRVSTTSIFPGHLDTVEDLILAMEDSVAGDRYDGDVPSAFDGRRTHDLPQQGSCNMLRRALL